MSKDQPAESRVAPQAVFNRSNMPSWWERLTGVSPKYVEDKVYLSFVAARYRGEERLPIPGPSSPQTGFSTCRTRA